VAFETSAAGGASPRLAAMITSEILGSGPEELGRILMRSFLKTCADLKPWRLLFLNNGVKLCLEGSPLLPDLHALEQGGTELLCCGTCLDYFQARVELRAGRVSNMREILDSMAASDRTLRP
jgi:selenium metabolism protein YedF